MGVPERVLDGLGPALVERAGDLLPPFVEGLTSELDAADRLAAPTARGWPGLFDLDTTTHPGWLGQATGTRVPPGLTVEEQRAYVRDRPAWLRGSVDALAAAVRALLAGDQLVAFTERDGSPWRLTVHVYEPEAGGVTEAEILAAANTQKPVGLVIVDVDMHPTLTYADLTALFASYGDLGAGIEYGDVEPATLTLDGRWWKPAARVFRYAQHSALAPTYAESTAFFPTYWAARDHEET